MNYPKDDARAKLATATARPVPTEIAGTEYARFYARHHDRQIGDARVWYARGQNFVLGYGELDGAASLAVDEPQEHVLLLLDPAVSATVAVGEEIRRIGGERLVIVPPGAAAIDLEGEGRFVQLVRSTSALADLAENAMSYAEPHPNIPEFEAWPDPVGGFRIRDYDLTVPTVPNSNFRLYRCTTFMVNYIEGRDGPRDRTKLSPHHHDDFEQCSLALEGEFVHHIRWPWGSDGTRWREDEHELCAAPSVAVISPPTVHTSEAIGSGRNRLIDIFSPPRHDFSAMEGWVLNADEYPAPDTV